MIVMKDGDLIQLGVFILTLVIITKPVGLYLYRVLESKDKVIGMSIPGSVERFLYRAMGIDPDKEQTWKQYSVSLICFSITGIFFTYCVLRLQHLLPLNPQSFGPISGTSGLNIAISFATNTNWQSYGGESSLSIFSQMVGLTFHNFVSPAAGISVAAALARGIARRTSETIGNFWVDLVRLNLYFLVPLSLAIAVFMVSQGVIQNFGPYIRASVIDQSYGGSVSQESVGNGVKSDRMNGLVPNTQVKDQVIAQGPVASQVAIKLLGTNGGGYMNTNASHPYENPTPLSNFFQMLVILMIPSAMTYYYGRMIGSQRHGWRIWGVMAVIFMISVTVCVYSECSGNPRLLALGVEQSQGNMEGKELRFGAFSSALFATVTTAAACGAVNSMHDSFTPVGGLVPLMNIQFGEVIFGGAGCGLYGMLVFVLLTVFLAGLMIGRTPEYLGKRIEIYDLKMVVFFLIIPVITILVLTAWTVTSQWGLAGLGNNGPHGLTEILYAYSSATGNNGSAFAGLKTNSPGYNVAIGIAMLIGRFLMMIPVLALAGNMARKKTIPPGSGTFPASGITFCALLIITIAIIGSLTFFPAVSLGPILEHLMMKNADSLF